jgi:hypothetical protein
MALFPYDGGIAHDVAFGPLVKNSALWLQRLGATPLPVAGPLLQAIATDGETYGHHHTFGEMALAATLVALRDSAGVQVENFASFLARHPAIDRVALKAPTSWSCVHGVERWRSDCGCRMTATTSQAWRGPLRAALEWLSEELHAIYATEAPSYFPDPWSARTTYGITGPPTDLVERARELIELERNALRMFTSCGWFFDDLAGIETLQILKYAARAIDLSGPHRDRLEQGLVSRLARAVSNDPKAGTGADLYGTAVRNRWPADARVAAGFAATAALHPGHTRHQVGGYLVGALGENLVQTQHRRTGHLERFTTQVRRTAGLGVEVELTRSQQPKPVILGMEAFPERERALTQDVLRREALRQVVTAEELVALAHGSAVYPDTLRAAVTRLVPDRPAEMTSETLLRLQNGLDLLALEALPVPFDAQTKFYRLLEAASEHPVAGWRRLAPRLGFARETFADQLTG